MKAIEIVVRGKVQGVYYRLTCQQRAKDLELVGYVMNEGDGSVFIHAQGSEAAIESLLYWCAIGPAGADVKQVIPREAYPGSFSEFEVRR